MAAICLAPSLLLCSLEDGHPGPHVAGGSNGGVYATWTDQTDDGVGASPAATAEPRTPSAQADQDDRPPTPSSPRPRLFELYRHQDVSGVTGTGTVAWGVEWLDKTATLRWHGEHPATAVWPNVEEILAVHGHSGATVLRWLDEADADERTCRACGCTYENGCYGGCWWVAEDLCSQCGDGPVV